MKISVSEKKPGKDFFKIIFNEKVPESKIVCGKEGNILEINIPEKKKMNWRQSVLIPRKMVFFAKKNKIKKIVLDWKLIQSLQLGDEKDVAQAFATNFEMANYEFVKYRTVPKEGWDVVEEIVIVADKKTDIKVALKKGQAIGQQTNACRDLANMPGSDMTPEVLVRETKKAIAGTKLKLNVLDEKAMAKLNMNAVLTVARGSKEKPRFIILEHEGNKDKHPIVLIGKGVTFDSGGLNIKPGDSMANMYMDMSAGGAVIQALVLAAKLGIKKRIIGLVPAVENMPSGESLRPGDIIKSMSGKTIEVQNTDAEGRIILADANTYAEKYDPKLVVNVATLTGAASVALGERASAIFSKDEKLVELLRLLGEESGDYVWPLPMWDEYEEEIKGTIGDVCNIRNRPNTRDGGTILGAMFIYQFAKKFPLWAHIDMGPRDVAVYDEFLAPGAAGVPVRLLIRLLEKF